MLAEVLQRRLGKTGLAARAYLERLDSTAPLGEEVRQLARELTVGETYFFRNIDQFRAFAEVVLPDRHAARAATRTLPVLGGLRLGRGAVLARDARARAGRRPALDGPIRGVDVNPAALEKAAAARYSTWSLRETPADGRRAGSGRGRRELTLADGDPRRRSASRSATCRR